MPDTSTSLTTGLRRLARIDRDLFRAHFASLAKGVHTLTIVTFEQSGRDNIQTQAVAVP